MRVRNVAIASAVACAATLLPAGSASAGWKHLPSSRAVRASAAAASPTVVLRRAETAFGRSSRVRRDVSPLLRRLATELPHLHGSARRRASGLLARPTNGAADPQQNGWSAPEAQGSPLCSAHYCVHWVESGPDAPDLADANGNGVPDWVEAVSATAEHVYSEENGRLGWRPPKGDGSLGGGQNLTDIYLTDVGGSGIYGYSAPDDQRESHSLYAYLVLDNDFSPSQFPSYSSRLDPLDVTLAHEYNHVLQFNYDVFEQTWFLEATAVWMEGKVYEPVHDYLQYLPGWVQLSTQPLTSFDGNDPNSRTNVKVYGSSVWNKWLDQRFGEDVVRNAWEDSVTAGSFGPAAYDTAIRADGGGGFADEFDRFAAATAEWQAQNSGFPDGALYPDVDRVGDLEIDGSPGSIKLDHAAYALANVPVTAAPRIRLAVKSPRGTAAALALVGRAGGSPGGTLVQALRSLPHGGNAVLTFSNPGNLSRLTAVLVNSDVQHRAFSNTLQDFPFKRDGQTFYSHASTDFAAPHVTGESPRPGARAPSGQKVTVKFSEQVLGVSKRSFQLLGPGGRAVSGRLKFRSGDRKATLVPRRSLAPGRYSVRLTSAITDLTLNRLGPPAWRFKVR
jgi:hypothetical protein